MTLEASAQLREEPRLRSGLALGLIDLAFCGLCIWAAWYHTPAGALIRSAGARALGRSSSAAPLLSYYSAGVYEAADRPGAIAVRVPVEPIPQADLLGAGALEALRELPPQQRSAFLEGLGAPGEARTAAWTAPELAERLKALSAQLGSDEAGMLALFAGFDVVRYAAARAQASRAPLTLVELSREMPPRFGDRVALASRALSLSEAFWLAWPVAPSTRITSPFGMRLHPILGIQKMHTGVDLGISAGTMVAAVDDGVVRRASEDAVNGRVLIIDHGRGVSTAYCHNQELLVAVGDRVKRGQIISRSGSSGRSTGPHLHYQLELGGVPVDPMLFRSGQGPALTLGGAETD